MAPPAPTRPRPPHVPTLPFRAALAAAAFVPLLCGPPVVAADAPAPRRGPTLAVEDTMRTEVPEVLVSAPRVTLDEILDRVARGEARRDSLLRDVAFTATVRVVRDPDDDGKEPQLLEERVSRVYRKKPGRVRTVPLRLWQLKPPKRADAEVSFSASTEEEVVNFAFRPEARKDFRYRIVGRDLLGDHLVYRIAFEPRSLLGAAAPGGLVWVDTRDFVIVRQELEFANSPVPLVLKGVDRAVIERQEVNGHWVLRRLLVRVRLTLPVPRFGRSFDMAIRYDDYAINEGIDDAVFAKEGR